MLVNSKLSQNANELSKIGRTRLLIGSPVYCLAKNDFGVFAAGESGAISLFQSQKSRDEALIEAYE